MSDLKERVTAALATVQDPEIHRPITELGMVRDVAVDAGAVTVTVALTVSGCPLREKIVADVTAAVEQVPGVASVAVELDVMTDEQRTDLRKRLKGGGEERTVPFAEPASLTRVYCVASAKGGVGKSSVTANLAAALARRGLSVGVLDADIYGHSIPRALGVRTMPVQVDRMIIPPVGHGVKVISMGMFTEKNAPVLWRGPMLHRALEQFLVDVFWGDLDVLLVDMPPGTGDVQITLAQMLPNAESLVVTTPHLAAAEVAERAGTVALQTKQRIVGVVENMAWAELPDGSRWEPFGSGGGAQVAATLTAELGYEVPLLGRIPIDPGIGLGADEGVPLVLGDEGAAASVLRTVGDWVADRPRGLAGRRLALDMS
ncbi:Mrp/NBP35 family ATP-binding protein [Glycomyces sp. L485]|uniref:Mrp/NBP35 family ATP-binding protein n=1 Tax=Glycomyces sp. L485 TaxID=2909235 RepID=UPI002407F4E6|nr:Mrp/NBP35 family ATP-binding protein [Glycomyces sp. L485]